MEAQAPLIQLQKVDADHALALLHGLEHLDPRGLATPESVGRMVRSADVCLRVLVNNQAALLVLARHGKNLWIDAALAECGAQDWTATLLPLAELQAAGNGCNRVAFQTARRGLVRKAQKQGYQVKGWILEKNL